MKSLIKKKEEPKVAKIAQCEMLAMANKTGAGSGDDFFADFLSRRPARTRVGRSSLGHRQQTDPRRF